MVAAQAQGQPVISVDTKKKELVGDFKNAGSDYRPKGDPWRVNVHDFVDKELGKAVPYGVYDIAANTGFVSLGIRATPRSLPSRRSAPGSDRWDANVTRRRASL